MRATKQPFLLYFFLSISAFAFEVPKVSGRVSHYSAYLESGFYRHHRYDLYLKGKNDFSERFSLLLEARARTDIALASEYFPRYVTAVRGDEFIELELRQLFADYLGDWYRIKAGVQYLDWVESLSPYANDILTSFDLRQGGLAPTDTILIPVKAFNLNHKFFGATLDWVFIVFPTSSRLAVADNGYGYHNFLENLASPQTATITENRIPQTLSETEAGLRLLKQAGGWDFTALYFYGHRRTPSLTVRPTSLTTVSIVQNYPRISTFGGFASYSQDAWVLRLMGFYEPDHAARLQVHSTPVSTETFSETRFRIGVGIDYVFSKHLKLYSEYFGTHTQATTTLSGTSSDASSTDYFATIRFTNETWSDLLASINLTYTWPKESYLIGPDLTYTWFGRLKTSLGAYYVHSNSQESLFESIKSASQVYLRLEYLFG